MTDAVSAYLAELESALQNAPADLRADILAGVREELNGLPADQVNARLAEFGDPTFIAAEATSGLPVAPAHSEPPWLSIVAALLVMLGGLIVPFVGAIAGFVLVWISSAWTRRIKVIAILAPLLVFVLTAAISTFVITWSGGVSGPGVDGLINPLVPSAVTAVWNAMFSVLPALLIDGIWLLVRRTR